MVAKTPTEALSLAPSSTDKTNLIAAADAMVAAIDAVVAGNTQAWTLAIAGTPTGGTYTITLTDAINGARTTSALAFDADHTTVQTALRLLAGDGISTTVVTKTGSTPNFTHTIQFKATTGSITVTAASSLTGGTPTVTPAQTVAWARAVSPKGADMFNEHFVDLLEVLATDLRAAV